MVSPERLEAFQQTWVRLVGAYGVNPVDAYAVFDVLVAAYSSPDRHYHNLEHINEMFRVAARIGSITDHTGPLHLAIWFHDAVYDSRAKDNEARSAELAIDLLGPIGVPASVLGRVTQLIHATAHMTNPQPVGDRDAAILLDADLAILGASAERYQRYAVDIRKEYSWVPETDYRKGRTTVLEQFLARPRLYHSDLLFQEGEVPARANIRCELQGLAT